MKTYHIKKNGYTLGQAAGKHKAVQYLMNIFSMSHLVGIFWGKFISGRLEVQCGHDLYSIEEAFYA